MTIMRTIARLAALSIAIIAVSSCDSRSLTAPGPGGTGGDTERPVITFTVVGAVNNSVILGPVPVSVQVKATDNKGVSSFLTTVRNGATVIATDTATIKPAAASSSRTVTVPLTGAKRGDKIVVRTTVADASLNTRTDSVVISVAAPNITFLAPLPTSKLNVADSLLVTLNVKDDAGVKNISITGYSLRGSAALGTQDTIVRYPVVGAPTASASFGTGVKDTTVSRYLKPLTPIDTTTDSLVVSAVVTDYLGAIDTARVTIKMVKGPNVFVLSPVPGDSATAGSGHAGVRRQRALPRCRRPRLVGV